MSDPVAFYIKATQFQIVYQKNCFSSNYTNTITTLIHYNGSGLNNLGPVGAIPI
jgi:hypothetical protein